MKLDLKNISRKLDISAMSTDIYIELITHGELDSLQLSKFLELPQSAIKKGLEELMKRGLIQKVESTGEEMVYGAMSILQLEEELERDVKAINNLKALLPTIQQPQKLGIIKYEGTEGIQRVYLEVLEEAMNTGEDILAFESADDANIIGSAFIDNYIHKRISSKIKAYVISPAERSDQDYKNNHEGNYTYIRMISDLILRANINIVGNLVMSFSLREPFYGTLRRDIDEAESLKSVFWNLWNRIDI